MQHANDTNIDYIAQSGLIKGQKSADNTTLLIYVFDMHSEKLELLDIEKVQLEFMEQVFIKNGFLSY